MQDLDIVNKFDKTLIVKEYIGKILNKLLIDYQNTQLERIKIARWEENQEFTILGIFEMLTDNIRGYAFQIINNNSGRNDQKILNELQKLKIFEIPELAQWYFSSEFDYPNLKQYLETLNYLRLVIIEYIRNS